MALVTAPPQQNLVTSCHSHRDACQGLRTRPGRGWHWQRPESTVAWGSLAAGARGQCQQRASPGHHARSTTTPCPGHSQKKLETDTASRPEGTHMASGTQGLGGHGHGGSQSLRRGLGPVSSCHQFPGGNITEAPQTPPAGGFCPGNGPQSNMQLRDARARGPAGPVGVSWRQGHLKRDENSAENAQGPQGKRKPSVCPSRAQWSGTPLSHHSRLMYR